RGFTVGPGRTLTVKVRLQFTSAAVATEVVANAAVVQRRRDDGDWVGQSNDYRPRVEAAPRTRTGEPAPDVPRDPEAGRPPRPGPGPGSPSRTSRATPRRTARRARAPTPAPATAPPRPPPRPRPRARPPRPRPPRPPCRSPTSSPPAAPGPGSSPWPPPPCSPPARRCCWPAGGAEPATVAEADPRPAGLNQQPLAGPTSNRRRG